MIKKSTVRKYLYTLVEAPKNRFDKVLKAWYRGIAGSLAGLVGITSLATHNFMNLIFTVWLALGIFFAIYYLFLRGR